MEKVLKGIRILDFARFFAGPYGTTLLADMGADVIRVERPGGELDREMGPFAPGGQNFLTMVCPRSKRGITLNLHHEKGQEILRGLVRCSDVVLHNFPVGTEEATVLDYESLKKLNPGVILVVVSGFGTTGPYAERPAFDILAQALSGAMSITGFPGNPPTRSAVAWVDYSTAAHAALGIMLALYHRLLTGKGQMIDLALLDVAVAGSMYAAAEYKVLGLVHEPTGNHSFYNFTDSFQAKDGWVVIAAISNPLWRRFLKAVGREDLKDDPRFKDDWSRVQNRHFIQSIASEWVKQRTVEEVVQQMTEARVPCSPIYDVTQMVEDPQVKAREMLVDVEYPGTGRVPLPGVAIKMSATPGSIERRAPEIGEHNQEVYSQLLGLTPKELSQLEAEGVI